MHCWQVPALETVRQLSVQTGSGCPHVEIIRMSRMMDRMGILALILLFLQIIIKPHFLFYVSIPSFLPPSSILHFFSNLFMGIELTIFSFQI